MEDIIHKKCTWHYENGQMIKIKFRKKMQDQEIPDDDEVAFSEECE